LAQVRNLNLSTGDQKAPNLNKRSGQIESISQTWILFASCTSERVMRCKQENRGQGRCKRMDTPHGSGTCLKQTRQYLVKARKYTASRSKDGRELASPSTGIECLRVLATIFLWPFSSSFYAMGGVACARSGLDQGA
jgi:hypothetical protein